MYIQYRSTGIDSDRVAEARNLQHAFPNLRVSQGCRWSTSLQSHRHQNPHQNPHTEVKISISRMASKSSPDYRLRVGPR